VRHPLRPIPSPHVDLCGTEDLEPASMFHPIGSKATVCAFPYMPDLILTGHESGKVALFDARSGKEELWIERAHMDVVTDL
jgi:translation initiation factor 3 subunit I